MDRVLIVSSSDSGARALSGLLRSRYKTVDIAISESSATSRQLLVERRFDLIIISAPLPDEPGEELAVHAAGMDIGVVLIVNVEFADDIASRVGEHGVFVLEKPLNRVFFVRTLQIMEAYLKRISSLCRQRAELQSKLDEQRFIGRAKCALVQYLGLDEQGAHRYIEKQAMDLRVPRRQIAENILKTYGS